MLAIGGCPHLLIYAPSLARTKPSTLASAAPSAAGPIARGPRWVRRGPEVRRPVAVGPPPSVIEGESPRGGEGGVVRRGNVSTKDRGRYAVGWSAVTPATSVILLAASTEASTMTADFNLSLS